jgi:hypothetical protein
MPATHDLFCYGTLCIPAIMRAVCDYRSPGEAASLAHYQCVSLHGHVFPTIVYRANEVTQGVVYRSLNRHHLQRIDRYEDDLYVRTRVHVKLADMNEVEVWTYVLHPRYYRLIKKQPWSLAEFTARHQAAYQTQHGW